MSSFSSSTPARLTALATSRLPRLALFVLVGLYALLGLFERDPWKTDDVATLASAMTTVQDGGGAWLYPYIGSVPFPEIGPWTNWVNAILIEGLAPFASAITATRFSTLLWLLLCLGMLWYATYLAGRRPEAQPLALPFGGEPKETQYGRLLGDISVLFLIGTVGIVLRTHETSIAPALIAFQATVLLGTVRLLDKPSHATVLLIFGISAASLTQGAAGAIPLLAGVLLSLAAPALRQRKKVAVLICVASLAPFAVWWFAINSWNPVLASLWWQQNGLTFDVGPISRHLNPIRDLPWFIWPTWPLALLAIWNWRKSLLAPHIWVPTAFIITQSLAIIIQREPGELAYIALTVPCAMLAAFSIPTLRRAVVNALDWFALMYFSVMGLTVWLGWFTQKTGIPEGISKNIARLTVGYEGTPAIGAVVMSLVVSGLWIAMIVWRLRLNPKAAWRGAWLCAAGLTSTWLMLVLLWMPTVDYVRSYRTMSSEIQTSLAQVTSASGNPVCIQGSGVSLGTRASLYVFDGIDLTNNMHCPVMLQQTSAAQLADGTAIQNLATSDLKGIEVLWEGHRGADRFDRYRLLLLANPS